MEGMEDYFDFCVEEDKPNHPSDFSAVRPKQPSISSILPFQGLRPHHKPTTHHEHTHLFKSPQPPTRPFNEILPAITFFKNPN